MVLSSNINVSSIVNYNFPLSSGAHMAAAYPWPGGSAQRGADRERPAQAREGRDGAQVQLASVRPARPSRAVARHQPQHAELRALPQDELRQRVRGHCCCCFCFRHVFLTVAHREGERRCDFLMRLWRAVVAFGWAQQGRRSDFLMSQTERPSFLMSPVGHFANPGTAISFTFILLIFLYSN
jgi:hypothetical protein